MSTEIPEKHSSGLVRRLGLFTGVTIVVSSMIGSGVFKKVASMSAALGSPTLVIWAWILAGVISLIGALTNAEAAGLIADPGGQYAYFKRMYGKTFAFFFGWASFSVIQSATVAAVAYVFSQSVNTLIPLPRLSADLEQLSLMGVFFPFDNLGVKMLTASLIGFITWLNYRGVKNGGIISDAIAIVITFCLVLIIFGGLFSGSGSSVNLSTNATGAGPLAGFAFVSAMILAMRDAFWAYEGWNNLGYLGGEIKRPERNIPLSLIIGVGFVMLLYTTVNFTYLYVLSCDELIAISKQENGIAAVAVVNKILGNGGTYAIVSLILIATFGSTNGVILTAARLYFSMAKDGLFFKSAAVCHDKNNTPGNALIIQGLWSIMLVFSGSFDQLTNMLVFAAFIYYGAMAVGVFVLRKTMPEAERPYKAIGYPVLPIIFILFCLFLVVIALIESPRDSLFGILLIATGLPFYLVWNKKSVQQIS